MFDKDSLGPDNSASLVNQADARNRSMKDLSCSGIVLHAVGITKVSDGSTGFANGSGKANPDGDFRDGGGYIFNLSTKGLAAGTYLLNFTAGNDAWIYQVQFQAKS